jgi:hypothetical protein
LLFLLTFSILKLKATDVFILTIVTLLNFFCFKILIETDVLILTIIIILKFFRFEVKGSRRFLIKFNILFNLFRFKIKGSFFSRQKSSNIFVRRRIRKFLSFLKWENDCQKLINSLTFLGFDRQINCRTLQILPSNFELKKWDTKKKRRPTTTSRKESEKQ